MPTPDKKQKAAASMRSMDKRTDSHRIELPKATTTTPVTPSGDAPSDFAEQVYERAGAVTSCLSDILARPEPGHRPGMLE